MLYLPFTFYNLIFCIRGPRGGAVGWGNAPQVGRSRVRFPIVSLEFFINTVLPAALWSWGWLTEMSTRNISLGWRRPVSRADNRTTFMCQLSWNLAASTFWNSLGLSRPVMGLLCLPLWSGRFGPSKILCSSELNRHMVDCMCIWKQFSWKYDLQLNGTWSAAAWAAWLPHRLCYSVVTFISLRLIPHPARKKIGALLKVLLFQFSFLLLEISQVWNCVTWNCLSQKVSVDC